MNKIILFQYLMKAALLSPALIIFLIYKFKKNFSFEYLIICSIFYFYLITLIEILFFPIYTSIVPNYIFKFDINLVPLNTVLEMYKFGMLNFLKQIVGNVIIFIPFGFLLPLLFTKYDKFKKILIFAIFTSSFVEIFQLIIGYLINNSYRKTDIDDILLNVIGTIIGYVAYRLLNKYMMKVIILRK